MGIGTSDDAAVVKLDGDRAIVQTLDVITPVVDDPYVYGQIAAANSLSDVFAMGAEVLTAMNIVGFDSCHLAPEVLGEILRGGASKVEEAGGLLVGGHTIETPEMTYGLSVTGMVDPAKILRNDTPKISDLLILTKPLGLGMVTTGIKADLLDDVSMRRAASYLARLNLYAARALRGFEVSACTDVTGFGLAGHAYEMSGKGRVTLRFRYDDLPILPEALEMAAMGIIPEGTYNNESYLKDKVLFEREVEEPMILFDAQTSGGLLIAVNEKEATRLLDRIRSEGDEEAAIVGWVDEAGEAAIIVE